MNASNSVRPAIWNVRATVPVTITPTPVAPLTRWEQIIMYLRALYIVLALALVGCSLSPSASVIDALAKDPATVCLTVTSIYGTGKFYRTAAPQASVACSQDGMTVKSGAGTP